MTEQYSYRMWLGTLEMTVHVVQIEKMSDVTWIAQEPIFVRVTVEVNDPSVGSMAIRTVHVADYAVTEWSESAAYRAAEHVSTRALAHSMERIAPTVDEEV